LTQEIARLAHCNQADLQEREERRDPLYYRLFKSFALGSYEGSPGIPVETLDADSIVAFSERVVLEAAAAGNCVIVGRGSQHYLQSRTDTLRFFLYASSGAKIRRLILEGNSETNAITLANTIDSERAAFIENYFHVEWPNRSLYHAMINTDLAGCGKTRFEASTVPRNSLVSTAQPSCKVLSSAPTMATLAIAWATLLGRFVGAGPIAACQPEVQRVGNNHDCAR